MASELRPVAVDSHVHVVADDRQRYPLRPGRFGRVWWERACSVEVLLAEMDGAGVDRAVVVQAVGAYGFDNGYLLDVVAAHPDRLVGIAAVDLDAPDAVDQVAELVARPGVAGVRCFAVGERADWVADGRALGEVLDASPTVVLTAFAEQLDRLIPVLADHPGTPVAVDHGGFPDWSSGPPFPVLDRLATLPHVSVKLTGHTLDTAPDPASAFHPFADRFGPDRLIAGSDWPQSGPSYGALWDELRAVVPPGVDGGRFLGANADLLWFGAHDRAGAGGPRPAEASPLARTIETKGTAL